MTVDGHPDSFELLPHHEPDAFLAFFRDALGFDVRGDVGYEAPDDR
jgi:hypothetical protein